MEARTRWTTLIEEERSKKRGRLTPLSASGAVDALYNGSRTKARCHGSWRLIEEAMSDERVGESIIA